MAIEYPAWPAGHLRWIGILGACCVGIYLVWFAPLPYVRDWWRPGDDSWDVYMDDFNKRHRIADGLLLTRRLNGKSRTQVLDLLGPPASNSYWPEAEMVYILGRDRTFVGIDSEWLLLDLDSEGRVTEARLAVD